MRGMVSQTKQNLTLRYHINFEIIINDGDKGTLCNLLKEWDKILEVQGNHILKGLGGLTVEQKNRRLHCGTEGLIKRSETKKLETKKSEIKRSNLR